MPITRTPAAYLRPDQSALRSTGSLDPFGDFQSPLCRGTRRDRTFCGAGKKPGAHPHLSHHESVALECGGRRLHREADDRGLCRSTPSSPLPANIPTDIEETVSRYGRVKLERLDETRLRLSCEDKILLEELARQPKVRSYLGDKLDAASFAIDAANRGVSEARAHPSRLSGGRPGRLRRRHALADQPERASLVAACPSSFAIINSKPPTFTTRAAT